MSKPNDQFEDLARQAADRIDRSRAMQEQLTLLPDEQADQGGEVRRGRGAGRAMSQMRDWLASRGLRLPEEVLAEIAGLQHREDVILATMADAERILTWAQDGAVSAKGSPSVQTMAMRVNTFMQLWAMRLRAADALMPYGAPKATPDAAPVNVTQIVVAGGQQAPQQPVQIADQARDVTPVARRIGPPPMPHQIQHYQSVSDGASDPTRADRRTQDGEH